MNRRLTNLARFILDECLPPIIRDSSWFMYPFYRISYRGKNIREAMEFKRDVMTMTPEDYANFYAGLDSISRNRPTDLNEACLQAILASLAGHESPRVLDAGCGPNGYLMQRIKQRLPESELVGLDLLATGPEAAALYCQGILNQLPFGDDSFDVVIASHVMEHCLDLGSVIGELKRVCRKELIVVVPKQRPYYYSIDEHLHFFYYKEQLLHSIGLGDCDCQNLQGDWFYRGRGSDLAQRPVNPGFTQRATSSPGPAHGSDPRTSAGNP